MKQTFRYEPEGHIVKLPLAGGGAVIVPVTQIRGASFWGNTSTVYAKAHASYEVVLGHSDFAALMRILAREHEEAAQRMDDTANLPFS